jgi:hypothetical protein
MYIHFRYRDGANPYITTTNKNFFRMICKYELTRDFDKGFCVEIERKPYKKTYEALQEVLRNFAIEWQLDFPKASYSWLDLAEWQSFFEEYGKKYGLLREFRENGII